MWQPDIIYTGYRTYTLLEDYKYSWIPRTTIGPDKRPILKTLYIPKNFTYDGASIPTFIWKMTGLRIYGSGRSAFLAHNFIYSYGGRIPEGSLQIEYLGLENDTKKIVTPDGKWSRKSADILFKKMLLECGASKIRTYSVYKLIRILGWVKWKI